MSQVEVTITVGLEENLSEYASHYKALLVLNMIKNLKASCCKEGSTLSVFLRGKETMLNTTQQTILHSNIIRAVLSAFASIANVPLLCLTYLS